MCMGCGRNTAGIGERAVLVTRGKHTGTHVNSEVGLAQVRPSRRDTVSAQRLQGDGGQPALSCHLVHPTVKEETPFTKSRQQQQLCDNIERNTHKEVKS